MGFSVGDGASAVGPRVFTQGSPSVLLCPACAFGGLPDPTDFIFGTGDVGAAIHPADYRPGWDFLEGGPTPTLPFDFPFDAASGVLRITWPDRTTVRAAGVEMEGALRTLRFLSRGGDPTLKGARPTVRVRIFAALPGAPYGDGLAAWPEFVVTLVINGTNDAPACTANNAPTGAVPARRFPQGGGAGARALLWPSDGTGGALALSDEDDATFLSAEVYFPAPPATGPARYDPAQDALAAWDAAGEADPAGGRIAVAPWDASGGVLRLSGAASVADYAAALATVGYVNTRAVAPRVGGRAVHARVFDGGGGTGLAHLSRPCPRPAFALADVAPVNAAPSLGWAAFPTPGAPPPPAYRLALGGVGSSLALFAGPRAVAAADPDDGWVAEATVALAPGSCFPGEDVLWYDAGVAAAAGAEPNASKPPPSLAPRFNASACALTLAPAGGAAEPLTFAALPSALAGVLYANKAVGIPRGGGGARTVAVTVTDGAVGGALPIADRLTSPPLSLTVDLVPPNAPPVLTLPQGQPWVLDGAPFGTPVAGGVVAANDDGEPAQVLRFFVTGGTAGPNGLDAFVIDGALGTLHVNAGAVDSSALGPAPTVEVTVWDRPAADPAAAWSKITFPVFVVGGGAASVVPAAEAAVAATGTLPVLPAAPGLPPAARPFLLHGEPSAACVDVGAAFLPPPGPGGGLEYQLLWHSFLGAPGVVVGGRGSGAQLPAALARYWAGGALAWGAAPGSGGAVQCVSGTPLAPPVRVADQRGARALAAFLPAPAGLVFSVRATPLAQAALANVTTWPEPPPNAAAAPLLLRVEVAGCMDPAAAYVPCVDGGGRALEDGAALAALGAPALRVDTGPPCANMCWDGRGAGACENACALAPGARGPCANPPLPSGGTSAAANPGGNYDPLASVPPQSQGGAACVYPPRFATATLALPLQPANLAAYALANAGGRGAPTASRASLGVDTGALPYLTSFNWSNAALLPRLLDEPQLRLVVPPAGLRALPAGAASPADLPPEAAVGAAVLELSLGALDALVAAASAPGGALAAAAAPAAPRRTANLTLPLSLARLSWPLDVPLPPLSSSAPGPAPIIDVHSLLRIAPGGVPLPPATAPARLCVWTAPPSAQLTAAWGADPARRVAPMLLAARLADAREAAGVESASLAAQRAAARNESGEGSSAEEAWGGGPAASAYAWLPRSGFTGWEALPLLGGGWFSPGAAAGVAGAGGAGGVPPGAAPASGSLCAELATLPALVAVAWAPPPAAEAAPLAPALPINAFGGAWALRADVNTDKDDGEGGGVPAHVSASSSPTDLVAYGGALFFSANSGARRVGRELWTTGVLTGGGAGDVDFLWEEEAGAATLGASTAATVATLGALSVAANANGSAGGGFLAPLLLALPGGLPAPAAPAPGPWAPVAPGPHATLVADLFAPGAPGASSNPAWLTPFAGKLLFVATGARGRELWAWDPRARARGVPDAASGVPPPPGGEARLPPGFAGDTGPAVLYPGYRRQALGGGGGGGGGGSGGAPRAHHVSRRLAPPLPSPLAPGVTLGAPPQLLGDLWPGTGSSNPEWLTPLGGNLLAFVATAPPAPPALPVAELWAWSDAEGSAAAPHAPLRVARAGGSWPTIPDYTDPRHLAACGGTLFFSAVGGGGAAAGTGRELWRAVPPRVNDSSVDPFTPAHGGGAWNVSLLVDIEAGAGSSAPAFPFCVHDGAPGGGALLFFTAWDAFNGREAWVLHVDSGSARLLAAIAPAEASAPTWTSAFPGAGEGAPPHWARHDGALFFAADDGSRGSELWELPCGVGACGWGVGAVPPALVEDALPGVGGSAPAHLVSYAGLLHFSAQLPGVGRELVALHPVARRAVLVANLDVAGEALAGVPAAGAGARGGDGSSNPRALTVAFGRLWFAADDGDGGHGEELFSYHAPPFGGAGRGCGGSEVAVAQGACAARLTAGAAASPGDGFGSAVAMDAGTAFGFGSVGEHAGGSPYAAGDRAWTHSITRSDYARAAPLEARPLGMRGGDVAWGAEGGRVVAVGAPAARGGAGAVRVFSAAPWGNAWVPEGGVEVTDPVGCGAGGDPARAWAGDGVGDSFGAALAVSGPFLAVGAPRAPLFDGAGGLPPEPSAGRVGVWAARAGGGGAYAEEARALPRPPDGACRGSCALGASVAVFGGVVVAGGPGLGAGSGGAWVWVRDGGQWRFLQALDPLGEPGVGARLAAAGAAAPALISAYGCAVGATFGALAVSACGNGGVVFLWHWAPAAGGGGGGGGRWALNAPASLLLPPTAAPAGGPPLAPVSGATRFGAALALHGTLLAVGAPGARAATAPPRAPPGAVFLYGAGEGGWWGLLGGSLAGDFASLAAGGRAEALPTWPGPDGGGFGGAVALTSAAPPALVAGAPLGAARGGYAGSGGALAVEPAPGGGTLEGPRALGGLALRPTHLLAPRDAGAGDGFGWAVAAAGGAAAVGAPGAGGGAGAVYVTRCATAPCARAGVYTLRACSPAHDRVCAPCAAGRCPPGTYEAAPCSPLADRVCAPCTTACAGTGAPPSTPCAPAADARCDAGGAAWAEGEAKEEEEEEEEEGGGTAGAPAATCVVDGTCGAQRLAGGALAPLPGTPRRSAPPLPPPPLPPDAGAPWRLRGALAAAFNASGGPAGLWRGAIGSAWAAHLAAGTAPCSGLDERGAAPPGLAPGPWPGLTCALDEAGDQVTAISLPALGLHGAATAWMRGDATPWLTALDLSGNPALALCDSADVAAAGGVCWGARGAPPGLLLPPALDTLDLNGCALGGGTFPVALLRQLPALRALSLWTPAGSGAGSDAALLEEVMEARGGVVTQ